LPPGGVRIELSRDEEKAASDIALRGLAMMLQGLAVENLAKGILVSERPELVRENGTLDERILSHDVKCLVEECLGELTDEERWLLDDLAEYTAWARRYPVPKRWTQLENRTRRARKRGRTRGHSQKADEEVLDRLFERLVRRGRGRRH